ncbi:hypothetical protein GOODEAATRI_007154 [Goodea atripinnis]|uniref:Uncharacterized protein n=1 Tax=Goodea atripinnis TaxID=208336 RepID=A0ABV0MFT0_9TELE
MAMKRTWGGPNAPHIKTLTLGKNIVVIQRATGNGPPDTKVVDVHLHGSSHNSLFISIRSRGRHPLTRLQRQKAPKDKCSLICHPPNIIYRLMITSSAEAYAVSVTFEYQHNFIKSAIAF